MGSVAPGLVVAALAAGCSGKKAPEPVPEPVPAVVRRDARADAASCAEQMARLSEWLKLLVSEGNATFDQRDVTLAVLAGVFPSPVKDAPTIGVGSERILLRDEWMGSTADPRFTLAALATELSSVVVEAPATPLILAIDRTVTWAVVTRVVQVVQRSGPRSIELLFTAGATKVAVPGPSSLDAYLPRPGQPDRRADSELLAPLGEPARRMPNLFEACDTATALMPKLPDSDDPGRMLRDELPGAIEACGCKVEEPAVRRWLWSVWYRDEPSSPLTSVALAIARDGVPLTMDPSTPWSAAHARVVTAARDGKPVTLK
jgi:hypothetical protein